MYSAECLLFHLFMLSLNSLSLIHARICQTFSEKCCEFRELRTTEFCDVIITVWKCRHCCHPVFALQRNVKLIQFGRWKVSHESTGSRRGALRRRDVPFSAMNAENEWSNVRTYELIKTVLFSEQMFSFAYNFGLRSNQSSAPTCSHAFLLFCSDRNDLQWNQPLRN